MPMTEIFNYLGDIKSTILDYFNKKGLFFLVNLIISLIGIFLISSFMKYKSFYPVLFGYSLNYLFLIGILVSSLIIFLILVFKGNKKFNRNLFISILIIFISLEITIIVIESNKPFQKDIYRYSVPYVMFTGEPNARAVVTDLMSGSGTEEIILNNMGFRIERDFPKEKPSGEIRIFVLGGSTVFLGSPLENSISGQIEKHFHEDGYDNLKVYNFGITSGVSGQELALLTHELVDYDPDLVIVYNGINDINSPYIYDPRAGYPYNFFVDEAAVNQFGVIPSPLGLLTTILRQSSLVRFGFGHTLNDQILNLEEKRIKVEFGSDKWEDSISQKYVDNLEKMCNIGKGFDFKFVAFLQPIVYFKSPLLGNEEKMVTGTPIQKHTEFQYEQIRPLLSELNKKYYGEQTCYFEDISLILDGYEKETYWDYIHIDNQGNIFVAEKIYEILKENKLDEF